VQQVYLIFLYPLHKCTTDSGLLEMVTNPKAKGRFRLLVVVR
jgi:hypothetical protein